MQKPNKFCCCISDKVKKRRSVSSAVGTPGHFVGGMHASGLGMEIPALAPVWRFRARLPLNTCLIWHLSGLTTSCFLPSFLAPYIYGTPGIVPTLVNPNETDTSAVTFAHWRMINCYCVLVLPATLAGRLDLDHFPHLLKTIHSSLASSSSQP